MAIYKALSVELATSPLVSLHNPYICVADIELSHFIVVDENNLSADDFNRKCYFKGILFFG